MKEAAWRKTSPLLDQKILKLFRNLYGELCPAGMEAILHYLAL